MQGARFSAIVTMLDCRGAAEYFICSRPTIHFGHSGVETGCPNRMAKSLTLRCSRFVLLRILCNVDFCRRNFFKAGLQYLLKYGMIKRLF
jgi:hypothetical protein